MWGGKESSNWSECCSHALTARRGGWTGMAEGLPCSSWCGRVRLLPRREPKEGKRGEKRKIKGNEIAVNSTSLTVLFPQLELTHLTRQENICLQKGEHIELSVLTGIKVIVMSTLIIIQRALYKSKPAEPSSRPEVSLTVDSTRNMIFISLVHRIEGITICSLFSSHKHKLKGLSGRRG